MKDFQFITNSHPAYIDQLYKDFVKDPGSIDADFRKFFEGFDYAVASGTSNGVNSKVETPLRIRLDF